MKSLWILLISMLAVLALPVEARDDRLKFPLESALGTEAAKEKLVPDVRLYFSGQKTPAVAKRFGQVQTNKKTNAFGKSDQEACEWVFLSAMIALQQRAMRDGGNAVVNIYSYYKKGTFESATEYECGAGNIMAGVTFVGDIVTLK